MKLLILAALLLPALGSAMPVTLEWTDPALDGDGAPLLDGVGTYIESSRNLGPWYYAFGTVRPLIPGAPQIRGLNIGNGLSKLRVVAYDDGNRRSESQHEIWLIVMAGRVWFRWVNET